MVKSFKYPRVDILVRPTYIDTYLAHASRRVLGQLRTSSCHLDIDVGRYACTPLEERICELRHHGVESDDIMFATILFVIELRRRYHCFFKGHFNALKIQYLLYKVEA